MQGLIFVAAALALGGMVCRLAVINWWTHLWRVVALHAALAMATGHAMIAAATGIAEMGEAAMAMAGLLHLYVTWHTWAHGLAPAYFESRPAPLDDAVTDGSGGGA